MSTDLVLTWGPDKRRLLRSSERYGALARVAFRDALTEIGVRDLHFELFEGGHGRIDYRYPMSLAYLAHRLAQAPGTGCSLVRRLTGRHGAVWRPGWAGVRVWCGGGPIYTFVDSPP
jgi:hypothetical protein